MLTGLDGDDASRALVIGGLGVDTADVNPNDAILDVESFRPATAQSGASPSPL